jgi:diguanylate cyclase (GGDEF)-like protein
MISEKSLNGGETISVGATTLKFLAANKLEKDFYDRIFQMTSRDSLTEAFSRAFFLEVASSEMARALLYSRPLTFCIMDLDHFKACNDKFGHDAGDFVLKEWIKLIRKNIRATDLLGRLGGEEFGFLLPEQNLVQAGYVISRLMTKTREHSFVYNSKVIPITFSAGLATISPEVSNLDMLIKSADQKLYSAKSAGGNCYIS